MRCTALTIGLVAVVSICAQGPPPVDSEYAQVLTQAEQLFSKGNQDEVIRLLTPWVQKNPKLVEAQHGLGLAYYQKPDFPNAIRHLSMAFQIDQENTTVWRQSVEILS